MFVDIFFVHVEAVGKCWNQKGSDVGFSWRCFGFRLRVWAHSPVCRTLDVDANTFSGWGPSV